MKTTPWRRRTISSRNQRGRCTAVAGFCFCADVSCPFDPRFVSALREPPPKVRKTLSPDPHWPVLPAYCPHFFKLALFFLRFSCAFLLWSRKKVWYHPRKLVGVILIVRRNHSI